MSFFVFNSLCWRALCSQGTKVETVLSDFLLMYYLDIAKMAYG